MFTIQSVRQIRSDYMIEVKVNGEWMLACNIYRVNGPFHTMGGEIKVGDSVEIRVAGKYYR